jgi:hypothetical protein
MREIKFRTWVPKQTGMLAYYNDKGKTEKMYYDTDHLGTVEASFDQRDGSTNFEQTEVMQFTGLYDGLGKEIYEKDIIEYEGVNSEIVFHQGMFGYMKPHKNGKTKGFNKLGIIGSLEGGKSTKLYRVRVVGNRFDNPSLIKE